MSIFPGGLASFLGFTSSHTLSADQHAAQHNSEQAEIVATQTKIGTGSSTPIPATVLRGVGLGVSSWAQVVLTTDVTGVLPQANGGTGTTLATGTGKAVYDTSPTISGAQLTTPTIASFTNATHTHANNAGGGQLNATNALSDNTISYIKLLTTIFSGQVTSTTNSGTAGGSLNSLNLGGLKLCWGTTATYAINATSSTTKTIIYPVGLFSARPVEIIIADELQNQPNQIVFVEAITPIAPTKDSFAAVGYNASGSTGGLSINWFSIGT